MPNMPDFAFNRFELSQYTKLQAQAKELDGRIQEIESELEELNNYNFSISPVYTGMPGGNELRDRIADYIIRVDNDRRRLSDSLSFLKTERNAIMYRLYTIRTAVNRITNSNTQDIIRWYYIDGQSVSEIAAKKYITTHAVYKRINRFLRHGENIIQE